MTLAMDSASAAEASVDTASKRRLRILLVIDHDIMVRHFLRSGACDEVMRRHEVTLLAPEEGGRRLTSSLEAIKQKARVVRLDPPAERRRLWSMLTQVGAMRPSLSRQALYLRRTWRHLMNWKAETLFTVLRTPVVYPFYRRWLDARLAHAPFPELGRLLEDGGFDVILYPGVPLGIYMEDLTLESRKRGIPFLHVMNSWDNPSLAIMPLGTPDHYVVWGEQTRRHAIEFLGMAPEAVTKFGAAQFEIYKRAPRIDRATFCERHEIDPARRILLYAGGSLGTNEFEHLRAIEEQVESGALPDVTIVYRPHPWGGGGNAGDRIIEHEWRHVRIESTMRAYLEALKQRGYHMSFPDYADTHDVLSSVDCVVSPLSTIIIEAALHGRPSMCFLPIEDREAKHFQAVHDLPHFTDLVRDPSVVQARGRAELIERLPTLLGLCEDPGYAERIAETCRYFVEPFETPYADRLRYFVEDYVARQES